MSDKKLPSIVKRILQTMKATEKTSTVVQAAYLQKEGTDMIEKYPSLDLSQNLHVDLYLHRMCRVTDLYHDGSVIYKSLRKGKGSASPYHDSLVVLKVKLEVDGEVKFCHENPLAEVGEAENPDHQAAYDLEQYRIPSIIRKILKTTKLYEIVQVRCTNKHKLTDHMPDIFDEKAGCGVFRHEWLSDFKNEVVITFSMIAHEQKEYIFKIPSHEKIERITFLKNISADCFRAGKFKRAEKIYMRIHNLFK
jgi:hypothetical protein